MAMSPSRCPLIAAGSTETPRAPCEERLAPMVGHPQLRVARRLAQDHRVGNGFDATSRAPCR
jgi:hypothetical protein